MSLSDKEVMMGQVAAIFVAAAFVWAAPAHAQFSADPQPQATDCAYTFTSGTGHDLTFFEWCVTENGNIGRLETPRLANNIPPGAEGYAVCSASGVHGADFGGVIPAPFGPATVVSGCVAGSNTCTISRDTTDGVFRLIQKFTQDTKEKEINIDHTLINLSSTTVTGVQLVRAAFLTVENPFVADWADSAVRTAWARGLRRVGMTSWTLAVQGPAVVINDLPDGCTADRVSSIPAPAGTYKGVQINYEIGELRPGRKVLLKVQYRRD
jgi:hypothetical protein